MAKTCMLNREIKRQKVSKRDTAKRAKLKEAIVAAATLEEKMELSQKLSKLDRNGAKTRQRNRCSLTGRPRGFYSRFGLSRNMLRQMASRGLLPGVRKASW
ncbi:MAG: 30S ribosomal protein S14 [Proteobacteria bacterium]|nr:30S ribosomal protein S14 [Pseudomonadota bacterium]NBX85767.1 30S ribosomal protein S14 [Pseudomonadota bacterium]